MKIPWDILNFYERYYEEELVTSIDENWKEIGICKTWKIVPKLLKLDPTKKPLLYRSVEFKKNDDWSDSDLINNENKFLTFLKEKVYQLCKSHQIIKCKKHLLKNKFWKRCFFCKNSLSKLTSLIKTYNTSVIKIMTLNQVNLR
jgi:hypothetical protein